MGYITDFPNGVSSFGLPATGASSPSFGLVYFVDGTNGNDGNDGDSPSGAFKTITAALAAQIANTGGLGDKIYILPGSYAESVTGAMSKVEIIGVNVGSEVAHAVSIRPTASYAYTGSMTDSAWRNILFMSPATSNTEYAAIMPTYMGYSTIDNCLIIGKTSTCVVGIQIGTPADDATTEKMDYSSIKNCVISTFYGVTSQFTYGIQFGALTNTNIATKQMHNSVIANNRIEAGITGISIGVDSSKALGTVIRGNVISSQAASNGVSSYGIAAVDSMVTGMVIGNHIKAESDGIYNFASKGVFDNYISLSGAAVVAEGPVRT